MVLLVECLERNWIFYKYNKTLFIFLHCAYFMVLVLMIYSDKVEWVSVEWNQDFHEADSAISSRTS